jgi:hypothetical protein
MSPPPHTSKTRRRDGFLADEFYRSHHYFRLDSGRLREARAGLGVAQTWGLDPIGARSLAPYVPGRVGVGRKGTLSGGAAYVRPSALSPAGDSRRLRTCVTTSTDVGVTTSYELTELCPEEPGIACRPAGVGDGQFRRSCSSLVRPVHLVSSHGCAGVSWQSPAQTVRTCRSGMACAGVPAQGSMRADRQRACSHAAGQELKFASGLVLGERALHRSGLPDEPTEPSHGTGGVFPSCGYVPSSRARPPPGFRDYQRHGARVAGTPRQPDARPVVGLTNTTAGDAGR